jgi:hypothetical protein
MNRPALSPRLFHILNIILDIILLILLWYAITIEYPTYRMNCVTDCSKYCSTLLKISTTTIP